VSLASYIPAAVAIVLALGIAGVFLLLAKVLGPKKVTPAKAEPFECGMDPIGSPRARLSVRFYPIAILFLVFDVEIALMYPWALWFRASPSLLRMLVMVLFVAVLGAALAYIWRKRAIRWE
jgi:NADH-quinone oxidoreductase subunit A